MPHRSKIELGGSILLRAGFQDGGGRYKIIITRQKGQQELQEAGLKAWSAIYLCWSTNNGLHEMQ